MIACKGLHYRYHKKQEWILDDFSHEFKAGIHLIKGFSGCGKSTLLRIMGGYLPADRGEVLIGEQQVKPGIDYWRRDLGFVFQQLNLLPLASVSRNLELAASLAGLSRKETKVRVSEYLAKLGLEGYEKRLPTSLSGGQQQRATIARALIKEPSVLLLDEPTSGLDDLNTELITKVLSDYISSGNRVAVICTHDSRLNGIADEILDFNQFLPVESHLVDLVNKNA